MIVCLKSDTNRVVYPDSASYLRPHLVMKSTGYVSPIVSQCYFRRQELWACLREELI